MPRDEAEDLLFELVHAVRQDDRNIGHPGSQYYHEQYLTLFRQVADAMCGAVGQPE